VGLSVRGVRIGYAYGRDSFDGCGCVVAVHFSVCSSRVHFSDCRRAVYGEMLIVVALAAPAFMKSLAQDEVFHIPQAQAYCHKQFDGKESTILIKTMRLSLCVTVVGAVWHPNITTFPGLYFSAVAASTLLARHTCTVDFLRAINVVYACGVASLLFIICNAGTRKVVSFLANCSAAPGMCIFHSCLAD
jgi:hypothetical protein